VEIIDPARIIDREEPLPGLGKALFHWAIIAK